MELNVARLREVLRACTQLVKSTRTAASKTGSVKTWDLWQADKLAHVLAELVKSDKGAKASSLGAGCRQLLDLVLEGSGRAKVKDITQGLPPVQEKAVNGKRKQATQNGKPAKAAKRKSAAVENETSSDSS